MSANRCASMPPKGESAECSSTVIARVQRKITLRRGRSIQKSDGSREKAFFESVGTCPQTFVSFSPERRRWKSVCPGCMGVLGYAGCFSKVAVSVDGVNGWEAGLSDGLGFVHDPL